MKENTITANPTLGFLTATKISRKLTIMDIVHYYLAHNNGSNNVEVTMWSEMNEIKNYYNECINKVTGHYTITEILRMCVRGLYTIGHQKRLSVDAINEAVDNIIKGKFVDHFSGKRIPLVSRGHFYRKFIDFEELYEAVKQLIGNVNGIGYVTIYDTARRIGYLLSEPIFPIAYVYLHYNKVNAAASAIYNRKLNYREPTLTFACEFKCLPSICIEDLLCIYSHVFIDVVNEDSDVDGTVKKFSKTNWRNKKLSDFWKEEETKKENLPKNKPHRWSEFSKR